MKWIEEYKTRPLLKVCGITCLEDALLSVEAGANALGFNFYPPSPRFVRKEDAEEIIFDLPDDVTTFAVVVHRAPAASILPEEMKQKREPRSGLSSYGIPGSIDIVQIHGLKKGEDPPVLERPLLVAVSPETAGFFPEHEIIIDTSWGTGKKADWEKISSLDRPYVLSGGLNPDNILSALEMLRPAGVDVCSGIESAPGRKDPSKTREFLQKSLAFYMGNQTRF